MKRVFWRMFSLGLVVALAGRCGAPPVLPKGAQTVLPAAEHLRAGVTAKYFFRSDRGSNYEVEGQLEYVHSILNAKGQLVETGLDAALAPVWQSVYRLDSVGKYLESRSDIYAGDTFALKPSAGYVLRWDGRPTSSVMSFGWRGRLRAVTHSEVQQVADTVWRDMPALVFAGTSHVLDTLGDTVSVLTQRQWFVEGLGLVYREVQTPALTQTQTLSAQLSPKQVSELRATIPKRVAYIDSSEVLLHVPGVKRCRPVAETRDYYNPTEDVHFPGGHRRLRAELLPLLDLTLLAGHSGYLTLRYVVNCHGEVSMITTNEADLDYHPKRFPSAFVKSFAETFVALTQDGRLPLITPDGKPYDYYAYLTLKLRDGIVVDLLP